MFTGIVECMGEVVDLQKEGSNTHLSIRSAISSELKIDQSVSHNGVCLTVIRCDDEIHVVTAIEETLQKSNLGSLTIGHEVNLERCVSASARLDGHIVQGHVDAIGRCTSVEDRNGSWFLTFEHELKEDFLTVKKGSIAVNGISLTVVDSTAVSFSVAVIPYTFEYTTFRSIKQGDSVNLEFDILGKYISTYMRRLKS